MCLGVPVKIVAIKEQEKAVVSVGGSNIEISIAFTPEVKEGDWVLVHAGFALRVIDYKSALEIRELLGEMLNNERGSPKAYRSNS